jgi:hypothetical protein
MPKEKRTDSREPLALPVRLDDGTVAVTRNLSASGMYLEIDGFHQLEGPVVFELQLAGPGIKMTAQGEVMRIDHWAGKTGVALRLIAPRLQSLR